MFIETKIDADVAIKVQMVIQRNGLGSSLYSYNNITCNVRIGIGKSGVSTSLQCNGHVAI